MMQAKIRQDEIRAPKQDRSRKRVDQILDAAKTIIAEKGSAGLTIIEIAEVAGITAGSMYQYFPNKAAIICALAERHLEAFRQKVEARLRTPPTDPRDVADFLASLIEDYYQTNIEDPVARDIWKGVAADKSLYDLANAEAETNVALLVAVAAPRLPAARHAQMARTLRLLYHFADIAIRVALDSHADEGRAVIEQAKKMLRLMWLSEVSAGAD